MKNASERYSILQNQMAKAIFNKRPYAANTATINKLAAQIRYVEKMIGVGEAVQNG